MASDPSGKHQREIFGSHSWPQAGSTVPGTYLPLEFLVFVPLLNVCVYRGQDNLITILSTSELPRPQLRDNWEVIINSERDTSQLAETAVLMNKTYSNLQHRNHRMSSCIVSTESTENTS